MGALPDQANRPGHIGGEVQLGGQTFHYGSGGAGRGSLPYGTYPINPGDMGPVGRRIGAYGSVGGLGGEIPDPKFPQQPREGILIHSASSSDLDRLYSEGCFAVSKAEWPRFRQALINETAKNGPMALTIGRDGRATIMPRSALAKKDTASPVAKKDAAPPVTAPPATYTSPSGETHPLATDAGIPTYRSPSGEEHPAAQGGIPTYRSPSGEEHPLATQGELNVTGYNRRGEPIYSRGPSAQAEEARKGLAEAQTTEHKVTGDGKIKVEVNAPKGTKVGAEGGGLFKSTEINRQTQMEPARKSNNRNQAGNEILSI